MSSRNFVRTLESLQQRVEDVRGQVARGDIQPEEVLPQVLSELRVTLDVLRGEEEEPRQAGHPRAEDALLDRQHFLERIANTTPILWALYDLVGDRTVYVNRQAIVLLGYTPEVIQAMRATLWRKLMHPDDRAHVLPQLIQQLTLAQDGEVIEAEYRLKQANGEWRWLRDRTTVFTRTADGVPQLILSTAQDITERKRLTHEMERLREQFALDQDFAGIVGRSKAMRTLFQQVKVVAGSDSTVLVQGESGTGKELIARAIHHLSSRHDRPFVTVDCGALPEPLLESELFGHVKGAFTDAIRTKRGLFEEAHGGTLFLDEIGDTAAVFQAKLLRILQEGEIRPVGSTRSVKVDVRIIAATNKDLRHEVEQKHFRQDLYYRLAVVPLWLPPLRHRREDIPLLVEHFIRKYCKRRELTPKRVSASALQMLYNAFWPGNVRELENVIERAVLFSPGLEISAQAVTSRPLAGSEDATYPPLRQATKKVRAMIEEAEKGEISAALQQVGYNRSRAAKLLGISRSTLYDKLKRYRVAKQKPQDTPRGVQFSGHS